MRFAFGETFHLRGMHAVEFVAVVALLLMDAPGSLQQEFERRVWLRTLASDVAYHAPQIEA